MKKFTHYKYYIFLAVIIVFIYSCSPKENVSKTKSYSFFVAGHVYGNPNSKTKGIYAPFINQLKTDLELTPYSFGVFTGDIVEKPTPENWNFIQHDLKSINCPVYFAPGNHDMGDRELYQEKNGNTDTCFSFNNDVFLFFDNTKYGWNLDTAQTILLNEAINKLSKKSRLFVFGHNVLWQDKYKCATSNSQAGKNPDNLFWKEVIPVLKSFDNNVYWFAGDVGATVKSKNVSYIKKGNIHLIASGMGNQIFDNYLQVEAQEEKVIINVAPLIASKIKPIHDFICK